MTPEKMNPGKPEAVRRRRPWQSLAFVLIITAIGTDLWRIQNSPGDLYAATTKSLKASKLADANDEFLHIWKVIQNPI
jgi:hypothetical protein